MKNIAWLKEEVEELDKEESQNYPHYYTVPLSDVRELIDQLDEPEGVDGDITGKEYVDWWNENISHRRRLVKGVNQMPKYETQTINGKEFKVIWEVVDDTGRVIEETISEEWANDIINDSDKHDEWFINDRLEEV